MVDAVQALAVTQPVNVPATPKDPLEFEGHVLAAQRKRTEDSPPPPQEEPRPNAETVRPEGDTRTAEQIIKDTPLLANLSEKERNGLKSLVGDYFTDADAAYRATRVLWHVENYDEEGKRVTRTDNIGNGRVDGFTNSGQAIHGTEAGRLQDVIKYGYGFLKGGGKPTIPRDPPTADTVRPKGDTRSAKEIIEQNPILADLSEKERNGLKERVGDYFNDADAAYRAERVLNHVENFDESGKISDGGGLIGNGRLDGFTNSGEAIHGTEAGRFQDFVKYGYDYLKNYDESLTETILPKRNHDLDDDLVEAVYKGDEKRAIELLKEGADPKAKARGDDISLLAAAARRGKSDLVQALLDHVPKDERKEFVNRRMPNGDSALHAAAGAGDERAYRILLDAGANEGAARSGRSAPDILDGFKTKSKNFADELSDDALEDRPEEAPKYADWLMEKIQLNAVKDINGFDPLDIVANPDQYTTEQRARAVVELEASLGDFDAGRQKGFDLAVNNDAYRKKITEAIKKISSPDVEQWLTDQFMKSAEDLFARKPVLKELAANHAKWMIDTPNLEGFEDVWKSTDDKFAALQAFTTRFDILNTLGGTDGKPAVENPLINIDKTGHRDEINQLIAHDFQNMNRFNDLIEGKVPGLEKMSPAEASKFLGARIATYALYGGNTVEMARNLKGMVYNYTTDHLDMRDIWEANGGQSLTQEQYKELLETYGKMYPDDVVGLDYVDAAAFLQKTDATLKGLGYWDMSTVLKEGPARIDGAKAAQVEGIRKEIREFFKGNVQILGTIFAGGYLAAHLGKSTEGGLDAKEYTQAAALSMMTLDMGMESFNRMMRNGKYTPTFPWSGWDGKDAKLDWFQPQTGERDPARTPKLAEWFNGGKPIPRTAWDAFNNLGKLSGGLGLSMLGGVGIANGVNLIQSGETFQGGTEVVLGGLNTLAGGALTADAALSLKNIQRFFQWTSKGPPTVALNKAYIGNMGRIAAFFAPISTGLNAAGLIAMVGLAVGESIAGIVNHFTTVQPWRDGLEERLWPYGISNERTGR